MNTPNGIVFMFVILSGVLQGCPLSGSLFVLAIDPLLHMFKTMLEDSSLACVRACADDIGISLTQLRHLPVVKILFDDFTLVSGLNLKAVKCVIILNFILAFEANCQVVQEWLRLYCPGWESMAVCNSAKYLGILLGPHAGQSQWSKALRKFQDRINTINSLHLPAELAKGQYTSRALPTLGYIAQVVPPQKCQANWHECCHEILTHVWELLELCCCLQP